MSESSQNHHSVRIHPTAKAVGFLLRFVVTDIAFLREEVGDLDDQCSFIMGDRSTADPGISSDHSESLTAYMML